MFDRRVGGSLLLLLAAALLAAGASTVDWWRLHGEGRSVEIGLWRGRTCERRAEDAAAAACWRDPDQCRRPAVWRCVDASAGRALAGAERWANAQHRARARRPSHDGFGALATAAAALAALAALVAAAGGGLALATGRSSPRVSDGIVVAAAAAAGAALAVLLARPAALAALRTGDGPALALVGAAAAVAGARALRGLRPGDDDGAWRRWRARVTAAPRAWAATLAAGAVAVALTWASLGSTGWLVRRDAGEAVSIGLQAVVRCGGVRGLAADGPARCAAETIPARVDDLAEPGRLRRFLVAGSVARGLGLAAALATVALGVLALAGQRVTGAATPERGVLAAASAYAAASLGYVALRPQEAAGFAPSLGLGLALAGAIAMLGTVALLRRWHAAAHAAVEAERAAAATPSAPTTAGAGDVPAATPPVRAAAPVPAALAAALPPCPSCGTPMLWVSARSRWLCTVCRAGAPPR